MHPVILHNDVRRAVALLSLVATSVVLIAGFRTQSPNLTTSAVALLSAVSMGILWSDRRQSYPLLAFTACLSVFLLGRQTLNLIIGTPHDEDGVLGTGATDTATLNQVNLCLFVTLTGVLLGWLIGRPARRPTRNIGAHVDLSGVRKAAGFLLCATAPFALYIIWRAVNSISELGFYTGRSALSSGPIFIHVPAALFDLSFFAYISARPNRSGALRACGLYAMVGAASLATLARADFVLSVAIIVIYLYFRQVSLGERWFTLKRSLVALAVSPALLALLNFVGRTRGRASQKSEGLLGPIGDFIRGQGVSIKVPVYSIELRDQIPTGKYFSFGPPIEFIEKVLGAVPGLSASPPTGQTAERALEGHQFAYTISYLVAPFDYLRGSGYGSSFVAELWVDWGIAGVFVGALFYALLLTKTHSFLATGPLQCFIGLMLLKGALFAPRASFTQPLVDPFSTASLLAFPVLLMAIHVCTPHSSKRRHAPLADPRRIRARRTRAGSAFAQFEEE